MLKYKNLGLNIKEIDEDNYVIRGVFSTSDMDRHGDIIAPMSWKLDEFRANPIVLFAHDHYQPAIGKVVELGYNEAGDLEGAIQFAAKEYPFAQIIFNLYKGKFMRAFSVGFMSGNAEMDEASGAVVLKENTLLEISTVNIPANAMALAKEQGVMVTKEFEDILTGKAKKMLDPKTREQLKKTIEALGELLEASEEVQSDDKKHSVNPRHAEGRTRLSREAVVKQKTVRAINKAVRSLLSVKRLS